MTVSAADADPARVSRFDHVAIAVRDLTTAVALYVDLLGGQLLAGGDDERLRIRTLQLKFPPGVKIELLQPLDATSPAAAFLDRHGEGFHHLTCFVDDVSAAAARLDGAGFETVDTRAGTGWWDETYVRPSSGFGTLLQLAHSPLTWTEPVMPAGATVADVLAGRIAWIGARPYWKDQP